MEAIRAKLEVLADAAKYDASCASTGSRRTRQKGGMGNVEGSGICHSYAPDGRCISLLKILLTNFCIYDCKFCINRVSSDVKRASFTPQEVVSLTLEFYRRNYIEGLFLSSGIVESPDATMEQMIEVGRSLRQDHKYNGYIHLKVVAGSSQDLIQKAGRWADRISANIEMPVQQDLDQLAPAKTIESATTAMSQIKEKIVETMDERKKIRSTPIFAPAGQSTQMIVGASASTDQMILTSSESLYGVYRLRRVYYSAYSPIQNADALLPTTRPSLVRENRLYQADWLLRFYGFESKELFTKEKNLSLDFDPKTAWALENRHVFPIDVNRASREMLLRIPGVGVRNADRILRLRRHHKVKLQDLQTMRVSVSRARFFVQTADHNPDALLIDSANLAPKIKQKKEQLSLFDQIPSVISGEL